MSGQDFPAFVNRQPRFIDASNSTAPIFVLCGGWTGFSGFVNKHTCSVPGAGNAKTVKEFLGTSGMAASQTLTEGAKGMLVFFKPDGIKAAAANTPNGVSGPHFP